MPIFLSIKQKIEATLQKLYDNDTHLFLVDANERSITHKLAIYLEEHFKDYDIDCEYNRNGMDIKMVEGFRREITSDDTDGVSVYPDIIVHHRNRDANAPESNFIVIEAKKSSNPADDHAKLLAYKRNLGYQHAYSVRLPVGHKKIEPFNPSEYIEEIQ